MINWKKQLKEYMADKSKPRDLIIYISYINCELMKILQNIENEIESFKDFTIAQQRGKFVETATFPIATYGFIIRYKDEDLVEFNFMWTSEDEGLTVNLSVSMKNHSHRAFDIMLAKDMGCTPDWLENCKYCDPVTCNLCEVDDLTEDQLGLFVIDTFQKMTQPYLA